MTKRLPEILSVLKQYWGYDSLRDGQLEILESVLSGRDTVAILPTGGGKSLCYQLPALLNQKVTVVVSPLLALMKDQAHHLTQIGIKTICLNSELKALDQLRAINDLASYSIIYVTPEFLLANTKVITILVNSGKLGLLAIDEAHCASSWGHDFRPSYLRLGDMKALLSKSTSVQALTANSGSSNKLPLNGLVTVNAKGFGNLPKFVTSDDVEDAIVPNNSVNIPILALTATAPPSVIKDIAKILKLENPTTIMGDLARKNLIIRCIKKTNAKNPALDLHKVIDPSQNTIVYTIKRDETDLIYDTLAAFNPSLVKDKKMAKYHADLSQEIKHDIYTKFINGEITVLIATIAFGMGIDKKDIRMIINWGAPSNLETYYQEIGRAGRDGNLSTCYLFWSDADLNLSRFHVTESHQVGALAKENLRKINAMENFLRATECRISIVISYLKAEFNMQVHKNYVCNKCDNCCIMAAKLAQVSQVSQVVNPSASQNPMPSLTPGLTPSLTLSNSLFQEVDYGCQAFLLFDLMSNLEISYGTAMLVAILRGSENKRITPKLKKMNSYGKGMEYSEKWWKSFIKFMIGQNYVMKVATNIQGHLVELLEVTYKANDWLTQNLKNNERKLMLREDPELISLAPKKLSVTTINPLLTTNLLNTNTLSTIQNPPQINSRTPVLGQQNPQINSRTSKLNPSTQETINQIKSGKTLYEVAKARALSNVTVEGHFVAGLECDNDLQKYLPQIGLNNQNIENLKTEMTKYEINTSTNLHQLKLKDVKTIFNGYNYLEIKIALVLKTNAK